MWADISEPITIVSAFVASFTALVGLFVWLLRRLVDKTIPEMQSNFSASQAELKRAFEVTLEKVMAQHREDATYAREMFKHEIGQERTLWEKEFMAVNENVARIALAVSDNQKILRSLQESEIDRLRKEKTVV